jgi:hypothetical protein
MKQINQKKNVIRKTVKLHYDVPSYKFGNCKLPLFGFQFKGRFCWEIVSPLNLLSSDKNARKFSFFSSFIMLDEPLLLAYLLSADFRQVFSNVFFLKTSSSLLPSVRSSSPDIHNSSSPFKLNYYHQILDIVK